MAGPNGHVVMEGSNSKPMLGGYQKWWQSPQFYTQVYIHFPGRGGKLKQYITRDSRKPLELNPHKESQAWKNLEYKNPTGLPDFT